MKAHLKLIHRATEEQTYDNGTMLTEMMLASEIKRVRRKIPDIISKLTTACTAGTWTCC